MTILAAKAGINCTYCAGAAVGWVRPPLCEEHLAAAVVVAHLGTRRLPMTVETVRLVAARYPQPGLSPERIAELAAPLLAKEVS